MRVGLMWALLALGVSIFAGLGASTQLMAQDPNYTPVLRSVPGVAPNAVLRLLRPGGPPLRVAQDACPAGFPVDCFDNRCCPEGSSCCQPSGCCPSGYPHTCGTGKCYVTLQDAVDGGCAMDDIQVCGVPVQ